MSRNPSEPVEPATPGRPEVDDIGLEARRIFAAAAVLLVVAIGLWAPFDLRTTPHGDGWILKNRAADGAVLFAGEPTRALLSLPWAIAQRMTPDSFLGIHLLFIAIIWAKGLAVFALVRLIPGGDDGIALLSAALLTVYPASTWATAIDGPLDRHWAVLFLLAAVVFLMRAMRRSASSWLIAMWAAQVLSLWTNEAILPVALSVPCLVWSMRRGVRRSAVRWSLVWLIVPVCNALHNLVHHLRSALDPSHAGFRSHGVAILDLGSGWGPMVDSVVVAYRRHFADCWLRPLHSAGIDWPIVATALMTACAVIAVALVISPRTPAGGRGLARTLVVAGLLTLGLGFAAFVPTSLRFTDGRSFIVSTVGAALAMSGVVAGLARRGRWFRVVGVVLFGAMIGLGAVELLEQRAAYVRGSRAQDELLEAILEQAPAVRPGTVFAVELAGTPGDVHRRGGFWPRDNVVENALQFLYGDRSLHARLVFRQNRSKNRLTPSGLAPRSGLGPPDAVWDYAEVLVYRAGSGGPPALVRRLPKRLRGPAADRYRPERVIETDAELPARCAITRHERPSTSPSGSITGRERPGAAPGAPP